MGLVFLGHAGLEGVVPRFVPIHMRVVGWAQNNEWVYVRGVREGPGKGGTISGQKKELKNDEKHVGFRDRGVHNISSQLIEE